MGAFMFSFIKKFFGTSQDRTLRKYRKIVEQINSFDEKYSLLSDTDLRSKTAEFKQRLNNGESVDTLLPEAYAVVKSTCKRLVGTEIHVSGYDQRWDMIPYDVQMIGAVALHKGSIAEMMTGEGKTLTAAMPLYLNALTGKPVHLVTVNDYLAERDCQWVGTIFRWLGLSTAALTNNTPPESRKTHYLSDIVYGTASEFGFDYLRDNSMATSQETQVQRGYYFAIIDEVDSILIDEARTPLIISGPSTESRQMYDELKGDVSSLVKRQRDLCNTLANEARKVIEKTNALPMDGKIKKDKKTEEEYEEALRKLWLVSKGMPRNKVLTNIKEDPDKRAGIDKWDLFYYGEQNKEEKTKALAELLVVVDEKGNEFELTDKGSHAWHDRADAVGSSNDFIMLDISEEFLKIDEDETLDKETKIQRRLIVQEDDFKRKERAHNLRQLLRAHLLMDRDVDYIIQDNKIVIIDENTGRAQPGRRFSDGLHQAIEAKEGLEIQKETQTFATVTLQNYFRMYKKLAGMTGTATTEAGEFKQVYKLEVIEIPTHRNCNRHDFNDEIYMSEREKYNAILKEVRTAHESLRPLLIGTESVEISEKLSRIFKQNKLEHTVLNAKQNEREAEIIAHAGKKGAITIATNMAGRGTDIKLEGGVAEIGGLYVIGTTRHQSRRIDRQLRGRCARQGDPGSSKFYVSFEDSLLRLFASPRLTSIIQRFRPPEGEPISASMLNKSIETAQKRIEQRNAAVRKHTLEYDDVMNKQRQEIYAFRNELLHSTDIDSLAIVLLDNVCAHAAEKFLKSPNIEGGWNPEGFKHWLLTRFPISFPEGFFDTDSFDAERLEKLAADEVVQAFKDKMLRENSKLPAKVILESKSLPAQEAIRNLILRKIDQLWQEHLLRMDHLRSDVNLRTVGQKDPLMEFKLDAFELFHEFSRTLYEEAAQDLFRFEIVMRPRPSFNDMFKEMNLETTRSLFPEQDISLMEQITKDQEALEGEKKTKEKQQPLIAIDKIKRNEACPCGSGKKHKKCCSLITDEA